MTYQYKTKGVCSRLITFSVEDNTVHDVHFDGGCMGNSQGVARLVDGMSVEEAIRRLSGIQCGMKGTSCPDQLAKALQETLKA